MKQVGPDLDLIELLWDFFLCLLCKTMYFFFFQSKEINFGGVLIFSHDSKCLRKLIFRQYNQIRYILCVYRETKPEWLHIKSSNVHKNLYHAESLSIKFNVWKSPPTLSLTALTRDQKHPASFPRFNPLKEQFNVHNKYIYNIRVNDVNRTVVPEKLLGFFLLLPP